MRVLLLVVIFFLMGCKTYYGPSGKAFPHGWGEPPKIQLKDYVSLPDGYGHGSSTLKHWIEQNKQKVQTQKSLNEINSAGKSY